MKHRRVTICLSSFLLLIAGGVYYLYHISFTDSLTVKRGELAYWLLIPSALRQAPKIEGKAPIYTSSPRDGNKPETITLVYKDLKHPDPALKIISDYLADRGIRVATPDSAEQAHEGDAGQEALIDLIEGSPGHTDIKVFVMNDG